MKFKDENLAKKWISSKIEHIKENGPMGRSVDFQPEQSRLKNELYLYGLITINYSNALMSNLYSLSPKFFDKIEELEDWASL